ncbi:MAG: hemerythrin domain-containing protein [Actinomycetota bacterium]
MIEQDHRTVEGLFTRYEAIRDSGTPQEKRQIVDEFIKELSVHAAIEENVLYPAIRDEIAQGDRKVDHSLQEHQEAKEALADLDKMDADDPTFDQKVATLMSEVRGHVEEEEGDILPKLRQSASKARLRDLARALRAEKKLAPTRPHPHAPDRPPASMVAGKAAGVIDRLRDRVSGRT